jgi:hypothetical protein
MMPLNVVDVRLVVLTKELTWVAEQGDQVYQLLR